MNTAARSRGRTDMTYDRREVAASRRPRVITWYGRATGRWWALVPWPSAPHGALLVEAADQATLNEHVAHLLAAFASERVPTRLAPGDRAGSPCSGRLAPRGAEEGVERGAHDAPGQRQQGRGRPAAR
ncbi:hypothetical protein ACQEU6_07860 [Spirillospora sp. CA-108201]